MLQAPWHCFDFRTPMLLLFDSLGLAWPQAELERLATSLGCTQTALLQDTTRYTC